MELPVVFCSLKLPGCNKMNKITPQLIIFLDMKAASTEQITSKVTIIIKLSLQTADTFYEISSAQ
jgi:hypothetical protein